MDPKHTTPTGDCDHQELAHQEWEQAKREREAHRAATETPGEDWDQARECWLRLEWRRNSPERRYNQSEDEWAEIGRKVGLPDNELLQDWQITLDQAKREMPARLAGAFERCALSMSSMKRAKPAGGRRPRLSVEMVQGAVFAFYKTHERTPTDAEIARALGVDRANFRQGKKARGWAQEARKLLS